MTHVHLKTAGSPKFSYGRGNDGKASVRLHQVANPATRSSYNSERNNTVSALRQPIRLASNPKIKSHGTI